METIVYQDCTFCDSNMFLKLKHSGGGSVLDEFPLLRCFSCDKVYNPNISSCF